MNEELEKESLIMMQVEKNGEDLDRLRKVCLELEQRLKNILLPENPEIKQELDSDAFPQTELRIRLKRHQKTTQYTNLLILDILDRLEL